MVRRASRGGVPRRRCAGVGCRGRPADGSRSGGRPGQRAPTGCGHRRAWRRRCAGVGNRGRSAAGARRSPRPAHHPRCGRGGAGHPGSGCRSAGCRPRLVGPGPGGAGRSGAHAGDDPDARDGAEAGLHRRWTRRRRELGRRAAVRRVGCDADAGRGRGRLRRWRPAPHARCRRHRIHAHRRRVDRTAQLRLRPDRHGPRAQPRPAHREGRRGRRGPVGTVGAAQRGRPAADHRPGPVPGRLVQPVCARAGWSVRGRRRRGLRFVAGSCGQHVRRGPGPGAVHRRSRRAG